MFVQRERALPNQKRGAVYRASASGKSPHLKVTAASGLKIMSTPHEDSSGQVLLALGIMGSQGARPCRTAKFMYEVRSIPG
jgi:hypothetical protein